MDISSLKNLGLTNIEINAYLSLLDLGNSTTGSIVERSKIPSSRIYWVLKQLIGKGLVSYSLIKNVKYFKSQNPERLNDFVSEQKKKLDEEKSNLSLILPELQEKFLNGEKTENKIQKIQTFEGLKGIKTAQENILSILKRGEEFIVFGAPKIASDKLNAYFKEFHKKRVQKGIYYRVIYNFDAKEYGKERERLSLTKVRYSKKGVETPSTFWIFKEYVALVVFSDEPIAIVIKNSEIAKTFKTYFEVMWNISKK